VKIARIGAGIGIGIAVAVIVVTLFSGDGRQSGSVFHVTLATPELYSNGTYSEEFFAPAGPYKFRFTSNGDSPQTLSIKVTGQMFSFSEDYELEGTFYETGISQYYTWDYLGQKEITIPSDQYLVIEINPHGNLLGPVSITLLPN